MFISLIVCAYNSEKYIKNCLDSILGQDFLDFELIVINDVSKDATKEIVESYKDERIILINKENTGLADSRNYGLKIARGEYVTFPDSDDELERDALSVIYNTINKSNADILRFSYRRVTGENKVSYPTYQSDIYEDEELDCFRHHAIRNSYNRLNTCWMHAYKRELVKDITFKNTKEYGFDEVLFNAIAYQKADRIQTINSILYKYLIHPESFTNHNKSWTKKILNSYFYLKEKFIEMNIYDEYKDDFIYTFLDSALLGNGNGKGGSLMVEYLSNQGEDPHACVKELINSTEMQNLLNDAIGHNVDQVLMNLYQFLINKDEERLFNLFCYLETKSKKEDEDTVEIKLNCKFDYMEVDGKYIAVPTSENNESYHGVLTLNFEAYTMLKELEKSSNYNKVKERLYEIFINEDKADVDTNLDDLITVLKTEGIIEK